MHQSYSPILHEIPKADHNSSKARSDAIWAAVPKSVPNFPSKPPTAKTKEPEVCVKEVGKAYNIV